MPVIDIGGAAARAAAHGEPSDRTGRLDDTVIAGIRDSGLLRHFVPRARGGEQGTFTDVLTALVELAQADPSAGWCAAVMASMSRACALLPAEGQQALWGGGPDATIAGTLQPAGTAEPTDHGWTLSGEWPYVSGIDHCQWALLAAHTPTSDGHREARFLLVPRTAWTVRQTWHSVGLRATGSHTLVLEPTDVPATHSITRDQLFAGGDPHTDAPCHRAPHEAISGLFFAAPLLGAVKGLLEAWLRAERARPPASPGSARDSDQALALSVGHINAAELLIRRAAHTADCGIASAETAVTCRLDYVTAAQLLVDAANRLFREAGTRSTTTGGALPRLWRDSNTAAVHPAIHIGPAARAYRALILTP